jgi:hypothetical protein
MIPQLPQRKKALEKSGAFLLFRASVCKAESRDGATIRFESLNSHNGKKP